MKLGLASDRHARDTSGALKGKYKLKSVFNCISLYLDVDFSHFNGPSSIWDWGMFKQVAYSTHNPESVFWSENFILRIFTYSFMDFIEMKILYNQLDTEVIIS